jgi:hypothetical protein
MAGLEIASRIINWEVSYTEDRTSLLSGITLATT